MSGFNHLYRRSSGIYFVRLCVPDRLRRAVGKGELHRSTGCRDLSLAKIVASELIAQWHRSVEIASHMDIEKLQAGSLMLLGDGTVPLQVAADECGTTTLDLLTRLRARGLGIYVKADRWKGWLTDDIHEDFDHLHDAVTGEVEVVIDGRRLGGAAAMVEHSGMLSLRFAEEMEQVLNGRAATAQICQFLFWPSPSRAFVCEFPGQDVALENLLVRRLDVRSITDQLVASMPKVRRHHVGAVTTPVAQLTLFSDLVRRYFRDNEDRWSKQDHKRRKTDHTKMFVDLCGDLALTYIDRRIMRDFATRIRDIPSQRFKFSQKYCLKNLTYLELIQAKVKVDWPGLSDAEQQKVLDTLSQIFTWAVMEGEMQVDPGARLGGEAMRKSKRQPVKAHEQRDLLEPSELTALFSVDWFAQGVGRLTAKGSYYYYRPHYYWLPLLALYCGGRLNELSQLYLSDIVIKDSIPCIDFNLIGANKIDIDEGDYSGAATDKSLKNISSVRLVPIPKYIIGLGFLEYVEVLRKAGYTRLFPELLFDSEKGYGKYAGKWFNDSLLGKQLKIPRDGRKTFHSMRHNFATALGALRAELNLKADLMGHKRKGATADVRYDKGSLLDQKRVIDQLTHSHPSIHPFDVEAGLKALKDALTLKVRRVAGGKK